MKAIQILLLGAIGLSVYSSQNKNKKTNLSRADQESKILLKVQDSEINYLNNEVFPIATDEEVLFLYELSYGLITVNDNIKLYLQIQQKYNILT